MTNLKASLIATLTLLFLGPPNVAAAAAEPPYPVWWSESLELDSLDAIEARLERHIWPGDDEGLPLHKSEGGTRKEAPAITCNDLTRLTEVGYYATGSNNYRIQLYTLAYCGAIALLEQAAPAERSYLRDFVLDEQAVDYLPAMVDVSPSCDFLCRQRVANERRIPLSQFIPVFRVTALGGDRIEFRTIGAETNLSLLARGDFDGDGLDDMLVLSSGYATEGSGGWTETFLLTRDLPDAVLTVMDRDGRGCDRYLCDATYDDPEALRDTSGLSPLDGRCRGVP